MSGNRAIELVCFDLGGVLVRINTVWSDLCRAARLDVRGESGGARAEHARRQISEAQMLGALSAEQWADAMHRALGGLYSNEEINALHDSVIIDEYPGVGDVIDDLHRAGVATACLSNTSAPHWKTMLHHDGTAPLPGDPRYPGVRRLGSHHASHLMRLAKPTPDIYRAFEKATGYRGAQILFFDDLLENVAAAREIGWHAERIDPTRPTAEQLRHHLARHGAL
jgi:putative hydrolase of the HAD superfamily